MKKSYRVAPARRPKGCCPHCGSHKNDKDDDRYSCGTLETSVTARAPKCALRARGRSKNCAILGVLSGILTTGA